jgi:hypothetical protein
VVVAIAGLWVLTLLVLRAGYTPIWDGRIYAGCVGAAAEALTFESLRCAGHASQAFVLIAALAQKLDPRSMIPLLTTNALLFALAWLGFHRLLRRSFPGLPSVDRALVTAAFAVHPAFLSAVVQPSLDLPLLPGFLWTIVFALERRWIPLVLTGLAMAFTKETGVLMYAVVLACYAFWFELRRGGALADRLRRVVRLAPLALPGIVFIAYLTMRHLTSPAESVIWYTGTTSASLLEQLIVPRLDLYQVNYAVLILVLNFGWIVSGTIALDAFVGAARTGHREASRPVPGADREVAGFLLLVTCVAGYALTRFTTFGHTRYFLVVFAMLLIPFVASLLRLGASANTRRVVLGAYALALLTSGIRTVDPISRRLYGTFAFGSHDMLRMTRVTGECCGFGQDQLAYSVEFTNLQPLTDMALDAIGAGRSRATLLVPDSTSWLFLDPKASGQLRFGYERNGAVTPIVIEHRQAVDGSRRPESAYYLAIPYGDDARARRELGRFYEFRDERRFERDGYAMLLYRLQARTAPAR